jgi:hypothetical protein
VANAQEELEPTAVRDCPLAGFSAHAVWASIPEELQVAADCSDGRVDAGRVWVRSTAEQADTRQGSKRCWAKLKVPAPLVNAAKSKSVPTAK